MKCNDLSGQRFNRWWIHKDINLMKLDHTNLGFIEWCKTVTDYQRLKDIAA